MGANPWLQRPKSHVIAIPSRGLLPNRDDSVSVMDRQRSKPQGAYERHQCEIDPDTQRKRNQHRKVSPSAGHMPPQKQHRRASIMLAGG
jgi:hypothetical protein